MLDGSYFCFVSLSTIGFGDIVPGDRIYSGQGLELSFIFCFMYLMLGERRIIFQYYLKKILLHIFTSLRCIRYGTHRYVFQSDARGSNC